MPSIYDGSPVPGTAFERIMAVQVPRWAAEFDVKSKDYNSATTGWEPHTFLGVKGQFADIWRKIHKIKKALWDEEALTGEQAEEIIRDLISHLFLTLDLLDTRLPQEVEASEVEAVIERHVELPDGGAREGARRLGVTEDRWHELVELADAVHQTGKPEILESQGFFILTNPVVGMVCQNCRWERTLETGTSEYHTYKASCKYRIRARRNP